ncbi:alpha-1-inhibitor 3-like [Penaeus chinensis]|uniref:alpha-1-inhibitor 3-like n=1 Tax=Penaeus chinensis TaxID=139456 RepID=UPI001FB7E36F|nr:alpha-1-inhibitor 3-like [Penaeus chinensis]
METPKRSPAMLSCVAFALLCISLCNGAYYVTTPRQWKAGEENQVCVYVPNPASPEGSLTLSMTSRTYRSGEWVNNTLLAGHTIQIPAGKTEKCEDINLEPTDDYGGDLHLIGKVGGADLNETRNIRLRRSYNLTFIQTDKYLYQPGQEVKFRALTVYGTKAQVAMEPYPEIWVTTPSRTRIAQWKNVSTSVGLVHLAFQLADEPEEGSYTIHVEGPDGRMNTNRFKVEEYVLPRFEVKMTPPKYVLASDETFVFSVCAKYTFGQPVKGNVSFTLNNDQRRKCRVEATRNETITGCKDFEITAEEMRITDCNVYNLRASAVVEEEGTGVTFSATTSANVMRTAVNFETVYADNYKKPNLPYTVKVRAVLPDKSPAAGVPVEVCAAGRCKNMTTAADGLFTAVVSSDNTNRIFMSTLNCRADMHSSSYSRELEHYYSPSNSSLLIQVPEGQLKCTPGQAGTYNMPIYFSATNQQKATFTVQVISRGKIQGWQVQDVEMLPGSLPIDAEHLVDPISTPAEGTVTGKIDFPVSLPPTASPTVDVLVWYTRDDGEVVSDRAELKVEKCLGYSANLTWSAAQGQPGEATTLKVTAEPNAVCSIGVVDRSTELLSPQPDPISLDEIFSFVDDNRIYPWINSQVNDNDYCQKKAFEEEKAKEAASLAASDGVFVIRHRSNYYSYYVDALKMFDDSGLYVISDFTLETRPCEKDERNYVSFSRPGAFGGSAGGGFGIVEDSNVLAAPPPMAEFAPAASPGPELAKETVTEADPDTPRTDFPETWLWDLVTVPSSGVSEQNLELPDTITKWVGKAVCAHPEKGVGLSERASITTFTPFFSDLTLPPSIKRGEVLPVKISVFNYLDQSLPVRVILEESPEYEVVEDPALGGTGNERTSCLAPQDKVVHTIKIQALALGDVNLTVSAFVDSSIPEACDTQELVLKRDTLIKPIKVEAEGFPREETWTKYVCAEELAEGKDSLEVWQVAPPEKIVADSARGWVTAVGDLLALSLENLGSLIRMPYGCGEQNMINFAPNIYIMQYLEATNQGTPESTEKLLRFMRTGYQRELLYRRNNGSYSAFGNADDSGSTWLTAFVLKSFAQAQPYISIDEEGLDHTKTWLSKSERDSNGCLVSVGKVFHKGLKGGLADSGTPVPLTAYVLTALIEAGTLSTARIVTDATRCVLSDTSRDPYTIAVKAYALALAKHPEGQTLLQQLIDMAVVEENAMYWETSTGSYKSNALSVETAGYAILAMMAQDPEQHILNARKVVKWITTKRNGLGGFFSTQDTVVALQAMASYETNTHQGPLDVAATVTAQDFSHSFTVNENNKLLQQLQKLPTFPTDVTVNIEGQGCAVMQAVLRYNIPEPEASDAFDLNVTATNDPSGGCISKRVKACSSYLLPDGKSNMAVIEVNLISGFIPEKEDLKSVVNRNHKVVKRYEVDGSKVSFYIEEFKAGEEVCVSFRILREVEIENTKPGSVVVYDYYQPEFAVSKSYSFPAIDGCTR